MPETFNIAQMLRNGFKGFFFFQKLLILHKC